MATSDRQRSFRCFLKWMNLQESDFAELIEALSLCDDPGNDHRRQLVRRNVEHFDGYIYSGAAPPGPGGRGRVLCTGVEHCPGELDDVAHRVPAFHFVRLMYELCGAEVEASLSELLEGARTGNLGVLSASQLARINALQVTTIREEEKLTGRMASLQEKIADEPIMTIMRRTNRAVAELGGEADAALDECGGDMQAIMEGADRLRLDTIRETVGALTPAQPVDFLAAGRKLHLCIHDWGKRWNHKHGRDQGKSSSVQSYS